MPPAAVRILHPEPAADAGELTRLVVRARALVAEDLAPRFEAAGADDVRVVSGSPDGRPFGARLRAIASSLEAGAGLVVLGSGSIPLATDEDLVRLVGCAASGARRGMTNNRFSSDVVAVGDATALASVPDLRSDNALARWLEAQDVAMDELPGRDRLGLDVDSPMDLEVLRRHPACPPALRELAAASGDVLGRAAGALDRLGRLARDPEGQLLVAGRLSAATLRGLEERAACRVRAFVEERGLRTANDDQRPPASVLGILLDRDGPAAIGSVVDRLADGAVIDSRVLLAHRHGADEAAWPPPEDRYASDLLLADRVRDPWLGQLTLAAATGSPPIALGGHTLVGPGLGIALGLELGLTR